MEGNTFTVILVVGLITLITLIVEGTNTNSTQSSNSTSSILNSNTNSTQSSNYTSSTLSSNATKNGTDGLDSRINLNIGSSHAEKQDDNGFSHAHSGSYALDVGRKTGNNSETLLTKSGANSGGFSSGPNAPLVFASSSSTVGDGFVNGSASAGSVGGGGSSEAVSSNDHFEIDMGDGSVIYNNLPQKSNSTKGNSTSDSVVTTTTLAPADNITTTSGTTSRPKGASAGGLVLVNN